MIKQIVCLVVICWGFSINSLVQASEKPVNEYGLFLSPNLCLLSQSEADCEIKLHVRWQTSLAADYCLMQSLAEPALKCWENSSKAEDYFELKLTKNATLYLVENPGQTIKYQQIIRLQRQSPPYRTRRKNPWRFY
ncbi:DUF3019 domain-containing protein [Aliikangiella maris]|uniref:DUF3019 domain-containing protein n=2 Tax=Aliikangiella maris TaxID=3162458 RepID=A0ABV3MQJ9_9GAMM